MPLPTWYIVDELRRAAKRLEELEVALDTLRKTQTAHDPKQDQSNG